MNELIIMCFFVFALAGTFILGGLGVMAYIYVTQGKQAANEFYKREF